MEVAKNAVIGALVGSLYGGLTLYFNRSRRFEFDAAHPDLACDPQLSCVLSRLRISDQIGSGEKH